MQENEKIESLLDEGNEQEISLLGEDNDTSTPTLLNDESLLTYSNSLDKEKAQAQADYEARKKYFLNPEVQAEIILDNYLRNRNYVVSGKEKRNLKREFLRNAKKGKYKKMFTQLINESMESTDEEKIQKLN